MTRKDKDRMVRLIAQELAAAIYVRDRSPSDRDMFAAGVADGVRSCAAWLGIEVEAVAAADAINAKEA